MSRGCDTIYQIVWRYASGYIEWETITRSLIDTLM